VQRIRVVGAYRKCLLIKDFCLVQVPGVVLLQALLYQVLNHAGPLDFPSSFYRVRKNPHEF
jgi:hypothetical protein